MFKADDYRLKIKDLENTLGEAKYALDIDNRYEQLKKLKQEQEDPAVWQDLERSAKIGREISSIEGKIDAYEKGRKALDDAGEIIDLIEETGEEELVPELDKMMTAAEKDIEDMEETVKRIETTDNRIHALRTENLLLKNEIFDLKRENADIRKEAEQRDKENKRELERMIKELREDVFFYRLKRKIRHISGKDQQQ